MVKRLLVGCASGALLLSIAVGPVAAAKPAAHYAFTPCLTSVEGFDQDGNPIGLIPAVDFVFSWSGQRVDEVSGAWNLSGGGDPGFGFADTDFTPARAGTVDAGSLTVQADHPEFDGVVGAFYAHNKLLFSTVVSEPSGGWTTLTAC